jgi:hypothetical protein
VIPLTAAAERRDRRARDSCADRREAIAAIVLRNPACREELVHARRSARGRRLRATIRAARSRRWEQSPSADRESLGAPEGLEPGRFSRAR